MAENDCVKREVGGDYYVTIHADHHEWRFLRQDVVHKSRPVPDALYDTYYCTFCLKLDRRLLRDESPTQYR